MIHHRSSLKIAVITIAVIGSTAALLFFITSRYNAIPQIVASLTASNEMPPFPEIDQGGLSADQQRIITILQREYELQPDGTKYSEGVREPWCADFVSWVFNEAGMSFTNPNSGWWRIPGTYTLRDYYESENKFVAAGEAYEPNIGDTMLYDNPSPFGQHVNIVIANNDGVVTTIGGNERGRIRIVQHSANEALGFVGYGLLRAD